MEAFSAHIDLMGASAHLQCDFVDKAPRFLIFSASVSAPECLKEARSVNEHEGGENPTVPILGVGILPTIHTHSGYSGSHHREWLHVPFSFPVTNIPLCSPQVPYPRK